MIKIKTFPLIASLALLYIAWGVVEDLLPQKKQEYTFGNFPLHEPGKHEFLIEQEGIMCLMTVRVVAEPIDKGMLYFVEIKKAPNFSEANSK